MDRLRRFELLICAAEAGSFSQAARLLQIDPSAVSHAVSALEKSLGLRLFHRTTRQLTLTDEGREVLHHARGMLRNLAEIQSLAPQAREHLEGTLRVGMSVSLSHHVMMPRMAEFLRRHPRIRLESLMLSQAKDMHAAGLDLMFHSGNPRDSELVARRIITLQLAVYAAPAYLEHAGVPQHPQDLLDHTCLVHKPTFIQRAWSDWEFSKGSQRLTVKVPAHLMTDDREGLLATALAGGGILRIGLLDPRIVESGQLVRVLADWNCPGGPDIHLLYRRSSRRDARVVAFLDFVDEVFTTFDPKELSVRHHRLPPHDAVR
jgi:DNA-binding transcriptional LysR family regulator